MQRGIYDVLTKTETVEDFEFNEKDLKRFECLKLKNELESLKRWFDVEYTRLEQKLRRLQALGLDYNGASAQTALIQLYEDAEKIRSRINEIEALVENY